MPRPSQKFAIGLAFVAAILSLAAAALGYYRTGEVDMTPLAGGLFMLAMGVGGLLKVKSQRENANHAHTSRRDS